ncbi:MAG: hypothetical protein J6X84_03310 [Treponema sp.]|nr:hypothetical protein [Treponema sp.]
MKSNLKKITKCLAVFFVATLATSCATTDIKGPGYDSVLLEAQKSGYTGDSGMIENSTPENSVLVYGWSIEPYVYIYYADQNNDWETIQKVGGDFCLPPVYKNAKLKVKASSYFESHQVQSGNAQMGYTVDVVNTEHKIKNDEWNVNIPKNTSLHFMGIHSIQTNNIYSWEGIQELRKQPGNVMIGFPKTEEEHKTWYQNVCKNTEKACLKKILKQYKGTAWEPVIKERLEELSK